SPTPTRTRSDRCGCSCCCRWPPPSPGRWCGWRSTTRRSTTRSSTTRSWRTCPTPSPVTDASSPVHVAFVRAVMIGREGLDRPVRVDMFARAGAAGGRSYLATGNVSCRAEPRAVAGIVDAVEHDLEALLGRATPIFVRSLTELVALVERDVFASEPLDAVAAR